MIINILIGFVALIAVLLLVVALRPADFRVSRTKTMSAPPAIAFAEVNNLHQWKAWSPWEKIDPNMKRTFEGPPEGVGSIYHWDGNSAVGAGSNRIIESLPDELIRFKLDMLRPYVGTNDVDFTFQPDGSGTKVTWTMVGKLNFITKAMDLFVGMDNMVGGQFETGLNQLKAVTEAVATK